MSAAQNRRLNELAGIVFHERPRKAVNLPAGQPSQQRLKVVAQGLDDAGWREDAQLAKRAGDDERGRIGRFNVAPAFVVVHVVLVNLAPFHTDAIGREHDQWCVVGAEDERAVGLTLRG